MTFKLKHKTIFQQEAEVLPTMEERLQALVELSLEP